MQRTTLQIPLDTTLRLEAEKAALRQGFSSLQEATRVFYKKLAANLLQITFEEPGTVRLSKKAEKRYAKISRDIKAGRNVYEAKNVDDLMRQLNADSLP